LSLADTTDFGVLRLIVNDNDKATAALRNQGFTVGKTRVLAVEVNDEPGGLNQVLDPLSEQDVNVEYMYAFANPQCKNAIMIFRFDDIEKAKVILAKQGIKVIETEEISKL
ncbi:amino acid-binding protein, partial [Desulfobacter sp.]